MPERSRGELLTMGRYTNPASFFSLPWQCNTPLSYSQTAVQCVKLIKKTQTVAAINTSSKLLSLSYLKWTFKICISNQHYFHKVYYVLREI